MFCANLCLFFSDYKNYENLRMNHNVYVSNNILLSRILIIIKLTITLKINCRVGVRKSKECRNESSNKYIFECMINIELNARCFGVSCNFCTCGWFFIFNFFLLRRKHVSRVISVKQMAIFARVFLYCIATESKMK